MSIVYNGEHSIDFLVNDNSHVKVNTWTDWFLVPTTRPVVNPPGLKTNIVDIPGSNGSIDLSEVLTGFPLYSDRSGQFEFMVDTDRCSERYGKNSWIILYTKILNYLHGQKIMMWLTDEPDFYYTGRIVVNEWRSEQQSYSKIIFNYQLEPFKYENTDSEDNWLWDPFNLETGVIRSFPPTQVSGSLDVTIPARSAYPVCPIIRVENSTGLTMTWGGRTYQLHNGDNIIASMLIYSDPATVTFEGNGEISLVYRGGLL